MADKYIALRKEAQQLRRKAKMCINKNPFSSLQEAFQKGQQSYKCPHCKQWHRSGKFAAFVAVIKSRQVMQPY